MLNKDLKVGAKNKALPNVRMYMESIIPINAYVSW